GRLVGGMPLARPLLITPSEHKLLLEKDGRKQEETVQVPAGRMGEVHFTWESGLILLSVLPVVLLLDEFRGTQQAMQELLEPPIEKSLQGEHLSVIPALQALEVADTPALASCLDTLACQVQLARKCGAEYVLRLQGTQQSPDSGWRFELEFVDTAVGDIAIA